MTSPFDYIIAGLGNPGKDYELTRHNAGFMALDILAERAGVQVNTKRFNALCSKANLAGKKLFLMKPQTFMNLSGNAIMEAAFYYKVPTENVLVLCDDISLPLGKIRVRADGSAGGHNGLKNIIAQMGGQNFPRIRIGVGGGEARGDELINWVIGRFPPGELKTVKAACAAAADAAEMFLKTDIPTTASKYNGQTFSAE